MGPTGKYKTCGNFDADSCLELDPVNTETCGAGESCIQQAGGAVCLALPRINIFPDSSVINQGNTTNLNWNVTNAVSCFASGAWAGAKNNVSGAEAVSPTRSSSYTLTCSNGAGNSSQAVNIVVRVVGDPGEF